MIDSSLSTPNTESLRDLRREQLVVIEPPSALDVADANAVAGSAGDLPRIDRIHAVRRRLDLKRLLDAVSRIRAVETVDATTASIRGSAKTTIGSVCTAATTASTTASSTCQREPDERIWRLVAVQRESPSDKIGKLLDGKAVEERQQRHAREGRDERLPRIVEDRIQRAVEQPGFRAWRIRASRALRSIARRQCVVISLASAVVRRRIFREHVETQVRDGRPGRPAPCCAPPTAPAGPPVSRASIARRRSSTPLLGIGVGRELVAAPDAGARRPANQARTRSGARPRIRSGQIGQHGLPPAAGTSIAGAGISRGRDHAAARLRIVERARADRDAIRSAASSMAGSGTIACARARRLRDGGGGLGVAQQLRAVGAKFDRPGEVGVLIDADQNLVEQRARVRRDRDRPHQQLRLRKAGRVEQRPSARSRSGRSGRGSRSRRSCRARSRPQG